MHKSSLIETNRSLITVYQRNVSFKLFLKNRCQNFSCSSVLEIEGIFNCGDVTVVGKEYYSTGIRENPRRRTQADVKESARTAKEGSASSSFCIV